MATWVKAYFVCLLHPEAQILNKVGPLSLRRRQIKCQHCIGLYCDSQLINSQNVHVAHVTPVAAHAPLDRHEFCRSLLPATYDGKKAITHMIYTLIGFGAPSLHPL
jgi:hypothetical protein